MKLLYSTIVLSVAVSLVIGQDGETVPIIAEIPLDSYSECGRYCVNVHNCKSLEFTGKTCRLLSTVVRSGAIGDNNLTRHITAEDFSAERCRETTKRVLMTSQSFIIQSENRSLYLDPDNAVTQKLWKRKKATVWVYNRTTQHLRVFNSSWCASWSNNKNTLSTFSFMKCPENGDETQEMKFILLSSDPCDWKLVDLWGRHIQIPLDLQSASDNNINDKAVQTQHFVVPPDTTETTGRRNLSSFQIEFGMLPGVCQRYVPEHGVLRPGPRRAPIFFEGQAMTFSCLDDYVLRIREQAVSESALVKTCDVSLIRDIEKIKCSNENRNDLFHWAILGAGAAVTAGLSAVAVLRKTRKRQVGRVMQAGSDQLENVIMSSNKNNITLCQIGSTEVKGHDADINMARSKQ